MATQLQLGLRATVHVGPKGGIEYRLHDDTHGTFKVVGKYAARPKGGF